MACPSKDVWQTLQQISGSIFGLQRSASEAPTFYIKTVCTKQMCPWQLRLQVTGLNDLEDLAIALASFLTLTTAKYAMIITVRWLFWRNLTRLVASEVFLCLLARLSHSPELVSLQQFQVRQHKLPRLGVCCLAPCCLTMAAINITWYISPLAGRGCKRTDCDRVELWYALSGRQFTLQPRPRRGSNGHTQTA